MFLRKDISFSLNKSYTQNLRISDNSKKKLLYSTEYEIYNNDELMVPGNDKNVNANFKKISSNSLIKNSNSNYKLKIIMDNHRLKNIGDFKLKNIIIFTRVYTLNCAINFKKYFETFGITTNIKIDSIDNTDIINCYNDDNLFLLLIGAQYLFRESKTKIEDLIPLPRNKYFIYEIEQLSQEFNLNLMKQFNYLISEPFFEFNYSILNFDYYNSISKTVITPLIDETNIGMINLDKEIDILFVGNVSPHRTRIIDSIKERGYNISVVNRKVGNELFEIVKKSKIIINIHYYNDSVFEVFRIHDFLAFDCNIISEPPENEKEKYLINVYKDIVDFYYSQEEMFNVIESNLHKKPDMVVRKNFIKSMNSKNKALINFNILGSILIKKYSNLFHKYFLQISNPNKNIKYNVKNYKPIVDKSILCHLHCSNITNFNTVYGKYINNLKNYFNIFITYTTGIVEQEMLNSFTIIQVPEYGMNIGPKFSFFDFIERIYDLNYSHILFLHDRFDVNNLNKYFEIIDEKYLQFTLNCIHQNIDGIFPDLLTGINSESKDMILNKIYIEEILNYLNINNKPNYFVKGDCMVLSKRIINTVFLDNKNLFYNILNNKNTNSFDLNWVRWYYKINENLENTYNLYKNNKLFGNNLSNTFTNSIDINNFDINTLSSKHFTGNNYSDSMIENVFEKIYLTVIDSFEGGSYITTGTEKKRIEEEKRRIELVKRRIEEENRRIKLEEERRIKKERLERVSHLENSLNLVIKKISTIDYENSERHRKIVFDIDNQEKEIEISKNNSLNKHNNNKIKTLERINNDREKEVSKKNQIYSQTSNDIKLTNEEINSENLKNDNEITRIDREKNIVEELCKEIDEEIENEKKMEVERQENEKNRIEQEKLNEIERRKKEAEWIEQEKINEIERRKKEKIRIKNEKELEIKKRSDFEKNIRLQRKLEKERRIREDNRFLKEEALEIDRIPLEDKRIEKLKIEALKKIPLEDERLDNLEKDEQTRILTEKKRIDKRKSHEQIDRPKRKKLIDELYLQQSKKYKEKINIINLKAEQKNKELKNIEEEIKNLNTLYNDKLKAEEERLDKILEYINIDYQNKLNHIELLKSKEAEEEKIQNNILIEKKKPLLVEKNNIDIELLEAKKLLEEHNQNHNIENYEIFKKSNNINILVRNTYRPSYFKKCIDSILNQDYDNYKVIICYDDDNCIEYLEQYKNNYKIEIFKATEVDKSHQTFYNLYCNQLLDKVQDGWIIFLDDDDMFSNYNVLKDINTYLTQDNNLVFWKFKRPDALIYPDINLLKRDTIANCGYCFHSKYKNLSQWKSWQGGDYDYIIGLIQKNNFNKNFIDKVLTQTTFHEMKVGNFGKKEEMPPRLYIKLLGGLGNQLFMLFNAISLSKQYNKKLIIDYDRNYTTNYFKEQNVIRKSGDEYKLFKNLNINSPNIDNFKIVNEKDYKYNKIELDSENDYVINGYYQSYKYFWKYREEIKKYIFIDNDKLNTIRNMLNKYGKKILAIHVRLGDYLKLQHHHYIQPLEYYKKALSYYNLENYKIILFSDDIPAAKNKLSDLNLDLICANDLFTEDEDQFLMLSLCDIKICANSTYSLMSCYFSEIYNFKDDNEYILPAIWFGPTGPNFNIDDLKLNYKFSSIDNTIYNSNYKCAVIFFHKNAYQLYKKTWIDKCIDSVLKQKNCKFDIFEINYGANNDTIFKDFDLKKGNFKHFFYSQDYETHSEAMVFILNQCFNQYNYDVVFNTNIDDFYDMNRFEHQLKDIIQNNTLLNSSLWTYIEEDTNRGIDIVSRTIPTNTFIIKDNKISLKESEIISNIHISNEKIDYTYIKNELNKMNNIINHSGVCFTKKFWNSCDKYGNILRYRNDKPYEDLGLWYRALDNNIPISILNKNSILYRIHTNQITSSEKKLSTQTKIIKSANLSAIEIGIFIFYTETFENILHIENNILKNIEKFYFIYTKNKNNTNLLRLLKMHKIIKYKIITCTNTEEINIKDIFNSLDTSIQLNCNILCYFKNNIIPTIKKINDLNSLKKLTNDKDIIIQRAPEFLKYISNLDKAMLINIFDKFNISSSNKKITFYTLIYKIKSKFSFETYLEWGEILIKNLNNHHLVIFTDNETSILLHQLINGRENIKIIIKELSDFKYAIYKDEIEKNTNKSYFPHHDIDYKLILIWLERHILIKEIEKQYSSDFYCHIDWGYFRENKIYHNWCNKEILNTLDETKIYFALIRSDMDYLRKIFNIVQCKENLKENLEKLIIDNIWSVGGGISIIPKGKIEYWLDIYQNTLDRFFDNQLPIKDDQVILINIFFQKDNVANFKLITDTANNDWFPFINFLNNNLENISQNEELKLHV